MLSDLTGLPADAVTILEHLEACRNLATELEWLKSETFVKALESAARQVYRARRTGTEVG